jgi:ribosome-associated protein
MLKISDHISLADDEFEINAIRAQGAGGQNVNKVSSAIHLRFDIETSSLPDAVKRRLLATSDHRITADGVVIIKAQNHRTQDKNRREALARLAGLIKDALRVPRKRIPTRPGRVAKAKRMDAKKKRGSLKKLRSKPFD